MNTLKQLQEKGEEEFKKKFIGLTGLGASKKVWWVDDPIRVLNWHHQQTTLAYNAGKADILDTVLKEIDTMIVHRPDELIKLNKDLPSILQEQSYLQAIGYCEALDTLKNKLLDNK